MIYYALTGLLVGGTIGMLIPVIYFQKNNFIDFFEKREDDE